MEKHPTLRSEVKNFSILKYSCIFQINMNCCQLRIQVNVNLLCFMPTQVELLENLEDSTIANIYKHKLYNFNNQELQYIFN